MRRERYLGMRGDDLLGKPYAAFWNPHMAPLASHAIEALAVGPVAEPVMLSLERAASLLDPGEHEIENGFCLTRGGALHVAIRTEMPDVSPAMVDWWFGWHSEEPQRYKLWHPRAHVHAAWRSADAPAARGRDRYVGRVSLVDEYLGSALGRYSIHFIPPGDLGLDGPGIADAVEGTAVCARVGFADYPVDAGYLVHHVRRVAGGAVMRSRFWIGAPYSAGRGGVLAGLAVRMARGLRRAREGDGRALLTHCPQEMTHLASFLPRLHAELGSG